MRKTFLFFIVFSFPYLISAQFTDSFLDGNFTNNPTWFGNLDKFEVDSSGRLHTIYDSVSSEIYLSTISKVSENAIWEFSSEYLFEPSSSNFSKIYLMSNNQDLTSNLNGYFVKVGGESGSIDGVSLERISPDLEEWQSSSSVSGYGTPTYQNSQYYQAYSFGEVSLIPEIFSPNNDGFEDVLTINWNFDRSDLMGSISIFNSEGVLLKVIVNNELLGSSGTKIWNGTDDNSSLLPQGIYIVLIDVLSDDGYINQYKKVVVLQN